MAGIGISVGNDHKLYYNSGTNASPVWVLIDIVGDVSVDLNISSAEVDLRLSSFVTGLPAKLSGGMNIDMASDIGGTVHDALRGFAMARTRKIFASANDAIATSGTQYFKAPMFFTAFPWGQETQNIGKRDCQLALAYFIESAALIDPSWVVVA